MIITASWEKIVTALCCLSLRTLTLAELPPTRPVPPQIAPPPWPCLAEDLKPDPAWIWGRLDNGLRYVIRKNALPAGHLSLRFCVQVGFANESKEERGFAHFVEHMAFNGTAHFPGETLVPELRRHGIDLGPELSAFTFLTYTVYNLDAPSTAPADLERWFTVLRDFADGMQFDQNQVKRERGVIASEIRDRESANSRADIARRRFLYPLSSLSNRLQGNVDATDRKSLRQFYDKWYAPERMILVAVGEVEPAQLESLIHQHFESLRPRGPPPPRFDPGIIENPPTATTVVQHDPKISGLSVEITSVLPQVEADSAESRRRWLARNMLIYLLNVRLQQEVLANPARLFSLTARTAIPTPYSIETQVGFTAPSNEWAFAVETLDQELRRSFDFSFTGDELREARAVMLKGCEQTVQASATAKSSDLASNVLAQAIWGFVANSPEDDLRRATEWLPQIDALEMNRDWRSLWQANRASTFGYGFFPLADGSAVLKAAFERSLQHKVEAPVKKAEAAFTYTDFGPPGRIDHREYIPELDLHLLTFANGVRVNLKRTTFDASTVFLTSRFGHGLLSEPPGKSGLGAMTATGFLNGGLARYKPEELRRIMSSSTINLNFTSQENAFAVDGQSSSTSLERMLQVLGAFLTDPGWDQAAIALTTAQMSTYYNDLHYTPEGTIGLNAFRILSGDDSRYMLPTTAQVKACTVEEMKAWFDPVLKSAPLEIGLVGDFDVEQTVGLLSRTLGALPARTLPPTDDRPVVLTRKSSNHRFAFHGESNRAGIEVVWPVDHCQDVKVSRQMEILCGIFGDRLIQKVREDLGAAYTPSVSFWRSEGSPPDGYVMAYITVKPGEAKRLTKLMIEIANTLSRDGATTDELAQARAPIVARSAAEQKENSYWVGHVIPRAQGVPESRQWPLTRLRDLQAATLPEINTLARMTLPTTHAITFTALPEGR